MNVFNLRTATGRAIIGLIKRLNSAREKYPSNAMLQCALNSELGEMSDALLLENNVRVHDEALDVAAVAIRIGVEGDGSAQEWRLEHSLGLSGMVGEESPWCYSFGESVFYGEFPTREKALESALDNVPEGCKLPPQTGRRVKPEISLPQALSFLNMLENIITNSYQINASVLALRDNMDHALLLKFLLDSFIDTAAPYWPVTDVQVHEDAA